MKYKSLIGCGFVKARMRSSCVVEVEVAADRGAGLAAASRNLRYTSSYLTLRHSRSMNTLSRQRPAVHADRDAVAVEDTR